MNKKYLICILILILLCLTACSSVVNRTTSTEYTSPIQAPIADELIPENANNSGPSPTPPAATQAIRASTKQPEQTPTSEEQAPIASPTVETSELPNQPIPWEDMPPITEISPKVLAIYQRGIELGNNPNAFSKIGDCGSTPAWFLGDFDRGPRYYRLGEYQYLEDVIETFQGSFGRTSLAAKSGFNASSIFSPLWSNREFCQADESPLACEYRLHRPIAAFIMLGTNDVYHPDEFEPQMRKIIEYSIEQGVIPILSTKADNLEGDGSINATIARLALEYEIPLINYWIALQGLPDHGLQEDKAHITWGPNRFDDPAVMKRGWPIRNLTALQILDELLKLIRSQVGQK